MYYILNFFCVLTDGPEMLPHHSLSDPATEIKKILGNWNALLNTQQSWAAGNAVVNGLKATFNKGCHVG